MRHCLVAAGSDGQQCGHAATARAVDSVGPRTINQNPERMKLNKSLRSSRLRVEIVKVVVQLPEFRAAHESGLERRQSGGQAHMKMSTISIDGEFWPFLCVLTVRGMFKSISSVKTNQCNRASK